MHSLEFLQDLAVVMIVAGLVTILFHRFKQPVAGGLTDYARALSMSFQSCPEGRRTFDNGMQSDYGARHSLTSRIGVETAVDLAFLVQ